MTREEILDKFTVNDQGVITSPGKFQGEMLYAPYFYDVMIDGNGEEVYEEETSDEECALLYTELAIGDEDRAQFPEISLATVAMRISESGNGFVQIEECIVGHTSPLRRAIESYEATLGPTPK